ncbi:MAG: phosphoserine phosphatase SerB [Proteobacteria bacterium]|nr:phosphoserine phosphatase SerB [Pseudomonadota bacterium]
MANIPAPTKQNTNTVVLHISGPDRSGVTAGLCQALNDNNAELLEIGQTVLHGYLTLSAIVKIPHHSAALLDILKRVSHWGLKLELEELLTHGSPNKAPIAGTLCITVLGGIHQNNALTQILRFLSEKQINLRDLKSLHLNALTGLELIADIPGHQSLSEEQMQNLRSELYHLGSELHVDIAAQRESIFRRNKRLICMDVDSTFIPGEVIDILGEIQGCGEAIAKITSRAMNGEIPFEAALRERVTLLKGLSVEKAQKRLSDLEPTADTQRMLKNMKKLGLKVGVVSGGFSFFVDKLKDRYNLDFAFSNTLEIDNGSFTGNLIGDIITADRKAQILAHMAQAYQCPLLQCVAIGDGANDIPMLKAAGLGIAFQAKSKVQKAADFPLNYHPMTALFNLMGYSESEIRSLDDLAN